MTTSPDLMTTALSGVKKVASGKVREIYDLDDCYLLIATDRISAFDVVMPNGVPDKGKVLNQLSAYWFQELETISSHHLITISDTAIADRLGETIDDLRGRSALVKKAQTIPIECVARGYITGSLYKEYLKHGGGVHGLDLPDGLLDASKLPEPIFTPATKATEGHDQNISLREVESIVGKEKAHWLRDTTLALYSAAANHAANCGIILADTKFEFGESSEGILWIDEALTPDSSRYWDASLWNPGGPQPSFDKQFVRDYLESVAWDKTPPAPRLPENVISTTREKYFQAFRRLTAREVIL